MVPVFDIEAMDWVLPIAVGMYDGQSYYEFLKTDDSCDVIWEFLKSIGDTHKGVRLFAHNAANYDNRFILNTLVSHKQTVSFQSGLGKLVWIETGIAFEDSYLLLGRGLAACCEAFDVPRKLEWDHATTRNIWELGSRLDTFRSYLKRDCISLSESLDSFSKILLSSFNITPSSTLALTSVKAFSKNYYPMEKIASNEEFERFIREATYGGRNETYRRYGENLYMYDVRRMFTSCYNTPVPIGKMHWIRPNLDRGTLAEAVVSVPDMQVGPLPYRYGGRLVFPVGEFRSWWDTRLLRFAAEELGCDVKLLRQLECEEAPILESFGLAVEKLSEESNEELGRIWKLFGLRLTGKLGQHRLRTEIRHSSQIKDFTGYCPIDDSEIYHETTIRMIGNRSPYIKPAISMRIRSEAALRHLKLLLGAGGLHYCDTDSVYTDVRQAVGTRMGDLRQVGFAVRAYFLGCKFYGYIDRDGALKQRTAGFRDSELTEYNFQKILEGAEVSRTFQSLGPWRDLLEGKEVSLVDRPFRFRTQQVGNRVVVGLETYPIRLPENP